MTQHEILVTETFKDWNGENHQIAKVKSAFSNHTMWSKLDDDGDIDPPFFASKAALTNNILREALIE